MKKKMVLSKESFQDLGVIDLLCNMSYIDDIKYFKARSQEIPPGRVDYLNWCEKFAQKNGLRSSLAMTASWNNLIKRVIYLQFLLLVILIFTTVFWLAEKRLILTEDKTLMREFHIFILKHSQYSKRIN